MRHQTALLVALALTGWATAAEAQLSVLPGNIDFGDVPLLTPGGPRTETISNMGGEAVNILSITFSGAEASWFRLSPIVNYPLKVPAMGQITVDIVLLTAMLGLGVADLTITTDDPKAPTVRCALKANSVGPTAVIDPVAVDFGVVAVKQPMTIDVLVKNAGSAPLHVTEIDLVDPMMTGYFTDALTMNGKNIALPVTVDPAGAIHIAVTFSPLSLGDFSADLVLTTDDANARSIRVPIHGSAIDCLLGVGPSTLDFGLAFTGSVSPFGTSIGIINQRSTPMQISEIALGGVNPDQFAIANPGVVMLAPGETRRIAVSYQPRSAGTHTAQLKVDAAPGCEGLITLEGSAVAFPGLCAEVSGRCVTNLDFGEIAVGATSDPITLKLKAPPGIPAIQLGTIRSSTPQFQWDPTHTRTTLNAGESTPLDISFAPNSNGAQQGTLIIPIVGVTVNELSITVTGTGLRTTVNLIGNTNSVSCVLSGPGSAGSERIFLLLLPAITLFFRGRRRERRARARSA